MEKVFTKTLASKLLLVNKKYRIHLKSEQTIKVNMNLITTKFYLQMILLENWQKSKKKEEFF